MWHAYKHATLASVLPLVLHFTTVEEREGVWGLGAQWIVDEAAHGGPPVAARSAGGTAHQGCRHEWTGLGLPAPPNTHHVVDRLLPAVLILRRRHSRAIWITATSPLEM